MANNQSQNSSSTNKSQNSGNGSPKTTSTQGSYQGSSHASPASSQSMNATSSSSSGVDAIEQAIAKGVRSLLERVEPELNRIGSQIVNRAMSRGQEFADTGVKRMHDQPWYMVGGALALVAVGVGLLFAYDSQSQTKPDFSRAQ